MVTQYDNFTMYTAAVLYNHTNKTDITIKILLKQLGYSEILIPKLKSTLNYLNKIESIVLYQDIDKLNINDVFTIKINLDHEIYSLSKLDKSILEKISSCDFLRKDNLYYVTKCLYEMINSNESIDLLLVPRKLKEMSNLSYGSINNCLYYIREREIL